MLQWREHVTDDTTIMVDDLISMKEDIIDPLNKKQDNYRRIKFLFTTTLLGYLLIYLILHLDETIFFALISFGTNPFHIAFIILAVYHHYREQHVQKQHQQENERYQNLRSEVIDHLKNTWYINEYSAIRDAISAELAAKGINIRYKSQ